MIVQSRAAEIPETILAKNRRIRPKLAFVESRSGGNDLEGGSRLHHVDDGPVFHFFGLGLGAKIQVEIRPICHCEDFSRLRPHQNNRGLLWRILLHRGVDLVLNNVLQTKVNSQMDLVAITRRTLLSAVRHDLLAGTVVFDEAITVLSMKVFLHRRFDTLDSVTVEVGESKDVTKHRAVWVNAGGVVLEINSAQVGGAKFLAQRACLRLGHFALDDDVTALTTQLLRELRGWDAELIAHQIGDRLPIVKVRGVGHYRLNRDV